MVNLADYEQWKARRQSEAAGAAGVVIGAQEQTPDQIAGDLNLASEFGKVTGNIVPPLPMVQENRNLFQSMIERKRGETILGSNPRLADWMRNPENAGVARDDLEGLSWWETTLGAAKNAVKRGVSRVPQAGNQALAFMANRQADDAGRSFGEILYDARDQITVDGKEVARAWVGPSTLASAAYRWIDSRGSVFTPEMLKDSAAQFQYNAGQWSKHIASIPMSPAGERFKGEFAKMGKTGSIMSDLSEFAQAVGNDPGAFMAFIAEVATESAPSIGVAVGTGLVTRSPGAAAVAMGATSGFQEYGTAPAEFFQEKGIDISTREGALAAVSDPDLMRQAMERGETRGVIIGVMDGLSGGLASQTLAKNPVGNMALQMVAQAFMGAGGEAGAQLAAGQDFNIAEVMIEGLAEFASAPIEVAGMGVTRVREGRAKARDAEDRRAMFEELSGQAVASKTRERMPDKFRQFVEAATKDGPVESVFIPADQFNEYFQSIGINPLDVVEALPGVSRDDYDAAMAGGGDLRIPTSTYAAHMAGSEHDAFLMENMRFDPNEFTSREAAEFNERIEEVQQEMWAEAERSWKENERWKTFEAQIYDDMVSRLRIAGRSTEVATTEAMIYPAFYRVMAERSGMGVDEFLAQYPLPQVQGAIPEGMQFKNVDEFTRTLEAARRRRAPKQDRRQSLLEFISDRGGMTDVGGELKARDAREIKRGRGKKTLRLARDGGADGQSGFAGMTGATGAKFGPDDTAQAAIEAGFMADHPDVQAYRAAMESGDQVPDITRALYEAIDAELRGERQTSDQDAAPDNSEIEALDQIEEYLHALGMSLDDSDDAIRSAVEADQAERGRQYAQGGVADLLSSARDRIAARNSAADAIAMDGKPVLMRNDGGLRALVGPNTIAGEKPFRVTYLGADNKPNGHVEAETLRDAAIRAMEDGFSPDKFLFQRDGHPFAGISRDQFLGDPKITADGNASTLTPKALPALGDVAPVAFASGKDLTAKYHEHGAAVFDGEKVIASYNFGDTLVVDKKYRRKGIASELVYQWRMRNPDAKPATHRTKKSQAVQEQVWNRIQREQSSGQYFQRNETGARGLIQIGQDGQSIIRLFETANLSTMLHESGHYFLTVMQDLAARGETGAAADYEAVKGWWRENAAAVAADGNRAMPDAKLTADDVIRALDEGSTGDTIKDGAVDVGMQEQWARAFEAYLMEGKAPSAELRGAFEKFRAWLISIYQRLAGLRVNMSDDISGVFDRMLASDAEIAEAQRLAGGNEGVFATAEAMGLTQEEFDRLMKLRQQSEDDAKAKLMREIMEPIKRERNKAFKEEKAKVRDEVTARVNAMREFRAIEWMGNRRWLGDDQPEALPDMRLSKDILVDRYGEGVLATLPRGRQTIYTVEGGIDPDDAAGWFGFRTGAEMIAEMERAPNRKEAISAETDREMRERHGDALNDGEIEEMALDAVHSDKRGQWIAAELKAVAEVAGVNVKMTAKDASASARQTIARMRVRDAVAAQRFLAAERKAAEEAARMGAMLAREGVWMNNARLRIASKGRAGDVAGTARQIDQANASTLNRNETVQKLIAAKRRQLMNHALYMEARAVADEVGKAERFVQKLSRASHRERIAGAGRRENAQIDYLTAIDEIMEQYDFRKLSGRAEERRGGLLRYVQAMTEAGRANELAIPDAVLQEAKRIPYKTLSVEALRGVVGTLHNLEHTALRWNEFLVNQRKREFGEARDSIVSAIDANLKDVKPSWVRGVGVIERGGDMISGYLAAIQTATRILRKLDGREDIGPAYELLKSDLDAAALNERDKNADATDRLMALFDLYSKDEQRKMGVATARPELRGMVLSKWNLIAMALNMGNEGNMARLTNERARFHLKPHEVGFVREQLLDARDAKFIQGVWDLIGSYRPEIAARDRRMKGFEPAWVEPESVTIGGVDLAGGYYPIKYDARHGGGRPSTAEAGDDILASIMGGGYASAHTKDGHLKARGAHITQSLLLDTTVITTHLNEVIHDLTHSEAIVNSWRLLTDGQVERAFIDKGLQPAHKQLKLWLQDAATGQVSAGSNLGQIVSFARSGFAYSKLAFSLRTILMQPSGIVQSMVTVGKGRMLKHMLKAYSQPVETAREVEALSKLMVSRRETFNKDLMDAAARSNIASPAGSRASEFMREKFLPLGMAGMLYTQYYTVDLATWSAAYEKGMDQFDGDSAKSVQYADMTISRAQGSGIWTDRTGVERGTLSGSIRQNPFVTLLTTLGSYFFAKMNLAGERTDALRAQPVTMQSAASYALDMMMLFAVEGMIMAAVSAITGWDDNEEDKNVAGDIAKETGKTFLAGLPLIRDLAGVVQGFDGGTYDAILGTVAKPLVQTGQLEFDLPLVKSYINLGGMVGRLPSAQINRGVDAFWRASEGEDVSLLEYFMGRKPK